MELAGGGSCFFSCLGLWCTWEGEGAVPQLTGPGDNLPSLEHPLFFPLANSLKQPVLALSDLIGQ